MDTQSLTYLFVGLSFALYIGIAIWSRAQSTNDFYIAGKSENMMPKPKETINQIDKRMIKILRLARQYLYA